MPNLSSKIAAAREAVAKATPGKWKANLYLGGAYAIDRIAPNGDVLARVAVVDGLLATPANARAIALAVNALPALLDVVEALGEMVSTQEEWERAVAKVIKSEPGVFPRAIDRGRAALARLAEVLS